MIIDCDTHIMPGDAFDDVPEEFRDKAPMPRYSDEGLLVDIDFPGGPPEVPGVTPLGPPGSGASMKGLVDLQVRLDEMPVLGVDRQFILPQFSGWWTYMIEPALASAIARSYNLSNLRLMEHYGDRIIGVALVQLQDVPAAIREMEWAREEGFCAVVLDKVYPVQDHPYGESLGSHKELWPFFARAEEMEMPIYLHNIQHGHRISNLPNFQKDGLYLFAPQEGQVSLVSLVTSGLLDDFPGLQFIFTEAGTGFIKPWWNGWTRPSTALRWTTTGTPMPTSCAGSRPSCGATGPSTDPRCSWRRTGSRPATTSATTSTSPSRPRKPRCPRPSSSWAPSASCSPPTTPTTTPAAA